MKSGPNTDDLYSCCTIFSLLWISLVLADLKALGEGLMSLPAVLATFLRWKLLLLSRFSRVRLGATP